MYNYKSIGFEFIFVGIFFANTWASAAKLKKKTTAGESNAVKGSMIKNHCKTLFKGFSHEGQIGPVNITAQKRRTEIPIKGKRAKKTKIT